MVHEFTFTLENLQKYINKVNIIFAIEKKNAMG